MSPVKSDQGRAGSTGRRGAGQRGANGQKRLPGAQRRSQLIAAARDVYLSAGYDGASLRKIADAAGVNHALIYQHFKSDIELFEIAVLTPLRSQVAEGVEAAAAAVAAVDDSQAKVAELHRHLLALMMEVGPVLGVLLVAEGFDGRALYHEQIEPRFQELITGAYRSLKRSRRPGIDDVMLATSVMGVHLTIAMDHRLLTGTADVPALAEQVSEILLHGLFHDGQA